MLDARGRWRLGGSPVCGGGGRQRGITPARANALNGPAGQRRHRRSPQAAFHPWRAVAGISKASSEGPQGAHPPPNTSRWGARFSCGPQRPRCAPPFHRPPHLQPSPAAATTARKRGAGSAGWRAGAERTRESTEAFGSPESRSLSVQVGPSIASETTTGSFWKAARLLTASTLDLVHAVPYLSQS